MDSSPSRFMVRVIKSCRSSSFSLRRLPGTALILRCHRRAPSPPRPIEPSGEASVAPPASACERLWGGSAECWGIRRGPPPPLAAEPPPSPPLAAASLAAIRCATAKPAWWDPCAESRGKGAGAGGERGGGGWGAGGGGGGYFAHL